MAPRTRTAAFVLVLPAALGGAACGRSPAMPAREVVYVRVEPPAAVARCDWSDACDDDPAPPASHVEYVPMSEWQPTPSVRRIEDEIAPRGNDPPRYIQFPQLTLHRPIPSGGRYGRWPTQAR
ncbi:MAG: hypothetical protein KIT84_42370 [Labilithrix sp.]|nr:hypothetical protein [Labilithrix sp.]MCW5817722.1 hypothetical protein [Labilithrix sp.]